MRKCSFLAHPSYAPAEAFAAMVNINELVYYIPYTQALLTNSEYASIKYIFYVSFIRCLYCTLISIRVQDRPLHPYISLHPYFSRIAFLMASSSPIVLFNFFVFISLYHFAIIVWDGKK